MERIQALFLTAENPFFMFVSEWDLSASGSFVGAQEKKEWSDSERVTWEVLKDASVVMFCSLWVGLNLKRGTLGEHSKGFIIKQQCTDLHQDEQEEEDMKHRENHSLCKGGIQQTTTYKLSELRIILIADQ